MPVEIKELVIKAVVVESAGESGAADSGGQQQEAPEKMIQACVERVLEILKDKKER